MIISDEDDAQKIKDPPPSVPTVRLPERAATRRPFSPLPDYETSQALAFRDLNESQVTLYKPPPRRRILDSRLWRVAIISLVVYIFLTLVIGVPIIVHVRSLPFFVPSLPHHGKRNTRRTRNHHPLPTGSLTPFLGRIKTLATSQAPPNLEYFLSAITGQWSSLLPIPVPLPPLPSFWQCTSLCTLSLPSLTLGCSTGPSNTFPETDSSPSLQTHPPPVISTTFRVPFTPVSTPTAPFSTLSYQSSCNLPPKVFSIALLSVLPSPTTSLIFLFMFVFRVHINCSTSYSHSSRFRPTSLQRTVSYITSPSCSHSP